MKILDGKALAAKKYKKLSIRVAALRKRGITPTCAIIIVGDNAPSQVYVRLKQKAAEKIGTEVRIIALSRTVSEEFIREHIQKLNADSTVHGIIAQLPLPKALSLDRCIEELIDKDVDSTHPINMGRLFAGKPLFPPPTAQSVVELIKAAGAKLKGADIVVVGAGFFGKQIAALCLAHEATVVMTHKYTRGLASYTRRADIVISVAGVPGLIKGAMIKKGAVVIDAGISVKDGKVVGDVDFKSVSKKATALTPVPGGVGPMTVACLLENVIARAEQD